MQVLFLRGGCFDIEGFTQHCVNTLHKNDIVFFLPSVAKSFSTKAINAAKRDALEKMRESVVLIREAIAAEFPSFDAVMAFHVFDLADQPIPRRNALLPTPQRNRKEESLQRLARLFQVDANGLKDEFFRLQTVWPKHISRNLVAAIGKLGNFPSVGLPRQNIGHYQH